MNIKILLVGCGNMGGSHARSYSKIAGFEIVGIVGRTPERREALAAELGDIPCFGDFYEAMEATKPNAVSINTYPDTHKEFALAAFAAGAHVFIEKPLAETIEECEEIVEAAVQAGKKLVIGYILRHHPSWIKFIEVAQTLGKPLVMRMNLNQQSSGDHWEKHKKLINCLSPIVDCGVHYVDIMCQMTRSKPVSVHAIGARLAQDIDEDMYNYGMLQVSFEDGSVGWYEAGWGPMMSETAFFVKDVVGPNGCVSIVGNKDDGESADIAAHTKTSNLLIHSAARKEDGSFAKKDELLSMEGEPDHQGLCDREQEYFLKTIAEDIDLTEHMADAISSLRIVLAADKSFREGIQVNL